MLYTKKNLEENKQAFLDFFNNLAKELENVNEDKSVKNLFPGFEHGDVAACKDLIGNALVSLTGKDVEIK